MKSFIQSAFTTTVLDRKIGLLSLILTIPFLVDKEMIKQYSSYLFPNQVPKKVLNNVLQANYIWSQNHPAAIPIMENNLVQIGGTCLATAITRCVVARLAAKDNQPLKNPNINALVHYRVLRYADIEGYKRINGKYEISGLEHFSHNDEAWKEYMNDLVQLVLQKYKFHSYRELINIVITNPISIYLLLGCPERPANLSELINPLYQPKLLPISDINSVKQEIHDNGPVLATFTTTISYKMTNYFPILREKLLEFYLPLQYHVILIGGWTDTHWVCYDQGNTKHNRVYIPFNAKLLHKNVIGPSNHNSFGNKHRFDIIPKRNINSQKTPNIQIQNTIEGHRHMFDFGQDSADSQVSESFSFKAYANLFICAFAPIYATLFMAAQIYLQKLFRRLRK